MLEHVSPSFLFTDIAGSTRRWEAWPEAMATALARHDGILRGAIEGHGGTVFKTVGDAFCAVFADPVAALGAAVAAQQALAAEDWGAFGAELPALSVRMALHLGPAEAREGDYFGPTVNRVARLLAAGHGGQVLLSQALHEAVTAGGAAILPTAGAAVATEVMAAGTGNAVAMTFIDLGEHRLKDLARPERIFQAVIPGLPLDFPPIATLDRLRHNLPVQLTSFVGREAELAELRRMLSERRLVTLTGVGGAGKTRLALQAAAEAIEAYPDGAWLVDLAPVAGEEGVPGAALQALGARDDPARPAEAMLTEHLRGRRLLLVLDNCEHVVAACAKLVAGLLQSCPGLTVLATSREPLAIDGESLAPVPPLDMPDPAARPATAEALVSFAQHEAVRLFLDRAGAVAPGFVVTAANAPWIAQICHRLDGIPLAIELAAARVKALGPEQIAARLDDRLRLLGGGGRDRLPRQQTLRAAIDWSYDLLPELERRVLERLSVCTGAVPLALIEGVCAGEGVEDWEVLDALMALVDKSLVLPVARGEERWYRLLETIRVYAAETLAVRGEELETRRRHLGWYRSLAAEAAIVRTGAECQPWQERLLPQAEDVLVAVRVGADRPELEAEAIRAFEDLWWLWYLTSFREASTLCLSLAARIDADAMEVDHPTLAWRLTDFLRNAGRSEESIAFAERARLGFRRHGDLRREAWATQALASASLMLGDAARAEVLARDAVALKRALGDPIDLSLAINILGETLRAQDRLPEAIAQYSEALFLLPIEERSGFFGGTLLANLGQVCLRLGQESDAADAFLAALGLWGCEPWVDIVSLSGLAAIAATRGQVLRAASLLGAAEAHFATAAADGYVLEPLDLAAVEHHAAAARALSSTEGWDAAYAAGRAMSQEEAVAWARGQASGGGP